MGMLGSQFFPDTDRSEFNIVVNASPGSSLEQTSLICEKVETLVKAIPEVKLLFTTIGSGNNPVTNANILVKLVPTHERKKSDRKIMSEIRNKIKSIPGQTLVLVLLEDLAAMKNRLLLVFGEKT